MPVSLRPDSTFDRFIAPTSSQKALALARGFAAWRTDGPRLLFLYGPAGVGKSHLLHSILQHAASREPASISDTTGRDLVDGMIAGAHPERGPLTRIAAGSMLAIDDMHALVARPATQREVGRVLSDMLSSGIRIACAATIELTDIDAFVEMLRELPSARRVGLRRPTERDVRRIVAAMAEREAVPLTPTMTAAIALRSYGDVRRAIGALNGARFARHLYH